MKDNLGARMKEYENVTRTYLTRRSAVAIRIDGKAFHTFTRGFVKPFDKIMMESMWETAKFLCANIQGCKMAYTQSDEISLLLIDYETIDTCAWFENNIQKMVSVSASMATLAFNKAFREKVKAYEKEIDKAQLEVYKKRMDTALFDSRVFVLPKDEVNNYFVWRQGDCSKNSIQMVARANFSHKSLQSLNCNQLQEKLFQEKDINWNNLPTYEKRGICVTRKQIVLDNAEKTIRNRWEVDKDIPMFTQDLNYVSRFLL